MMCMCLFGWCVCFFLCVCSHMHTQTVYMCLMCWTRMLVFCNSGSGSLAAMSVFEDRYKPNMEVWKIQNLLL